GHLRHAKDIVPAPATCPTQPVSSEKGGGRPLTATLTGAAEVPGPGDPDGRGTATIRLNQGQGKVCFALTASNITLPAAAAHIHVGGSTVAGPIVVGLTAPDATGFSAGCVSASRELIAAIRKNPSNYYVNVHTSDYPAGAIRGQL
ncbi:MAG: CHRD domain-containing protein, partial [Actinomycetota bacterium]|nr:CHRD domain-containing protein [Actinomycetota bacterium]